MCNHFLDAFGLFSASDGDRRLLFCFGPSRRLSFVFVCVGFRFLDRFCSKWYELRTY